jgi:hypothetical protein
MVLAVCNLQVLDTEGNAQGSASIEVRREEGGAPLVTVYSDREGTIPLGNPFTADADGHFAFYVAGGAYRITATKGGFSKTWRHVPIGLAQETDILTTGVRYRFSADTDDSDPGDFYLKFNNSDLASVTEIYISDIGEAGSDLSAYIDTFDDGGESSNRGNLFIESGDGEAFMLARVTGTVANDGSPSTYRTVSVTVTSSQGSFTADRVCSILFSQAGGGLSSPVSLADIQDISTARILGRDTAGSGVIEQLTLSEALDLIGSAAQGDILYRGASDWARLGAGSNRRFLQSQGAGADLQWADAGLTLLTSGSVSAAATLDIVLTAYTAYRGLQILLYDFIPATNNVDLWARVSTDGGSNYDASAGNYKYANAATYSTVDTVFGTPRNNSAIAVILAASVGNVSDEGVDSAALLLGQTNTAKKPKLRWDSIGYTHDDAAERISGSGIRNAAQDTDAIRFLFSSGNIASGNYAVFGLA